MMLGVGAIAVSSATGQEQTRWKEAAIRESDRYGVAADFVEARMDGRQLLGEATPSRSALDGLLVVAATSVFLIFGAMARVPHMSLHCGPAALLTAVLCLLLAISGTALW